MPRDQDAAPSSSFRLAGTTMILAVIVVVGAFLRFDGLGARSLWLDEFCTWHVSRIELGESLRWRPELTIPPLYQLTLRLMSSSSHPPEWLLRLPAVVCGTLTILAAFWFGRVLCGAAIGCILAALVAVNDLQLDFSQEARPYTMLVLGCTLSFTFWHRLVTRHHRADFWGYVAVTVLTFYAHFLVALTILAQLAWWVGTFVFAKGRDKPPPLAKGGKPGVLTGQARGSSTASDRGGERCRSFRPLWAMSFVALFGAPLIVRAVYFRESTAQAIGWVQPWNWKRGASLLHEITFGPVWSILIVVLAAMISIAAAMKWKMPGQREMGPCGSARRIETAGVLVTWILFAWVGLQVISVLAVPMTVARYALPAAIPTLLLPLVLAEQVHRRAPLVLAAVFIVGNAPGWLTRTWDVAPGFRELVAYVREHVDPENEAVVLAIAPTATPDWAEMRRLALQYYPLDDRPIFEVQPDAAGRVPPGSILEDPRALYLIVFRMDPTAMILQAGRKPAPIIVDGRSYSRLAFLPYRLWKVAPMER